MQYIQPFLANKRASLQVHIVVRSPDNFDAWKKSREREPVTLVARHSLHSPGGDNRTYRVRADDAHADILEL